MTREQIQSLFEQRTDAWRRRDAAALAARHCEDGIVYSPMFGTVKGRQAIELSYQQLFSTFNDWDFQPRELLIDGDLAAQAFTVSATHSSEFLGLPGTGRRFQVQGVLLFRFNEHGIVEERRMYDFTALLVQLGILRAKSAKA